MASQVSRMSGKGEINAPSKSKKSKGASAGLAVESGVKKPKKAGAGARVSSKKINSPTKTHLERHYAHFYASQSWQSNYEFAQPTKKNFSAPEDMNDPVGTMETFPSTEKYYQYQKAKFIAESECQREDSKTDKYQGLTAANAASEVFKLSKTHQMKEVTHGFIFTQADQAAWRVRQKRILYIGNFYKFTSPGMEGFRHWLHTTGNRFIVQANGRKSPCARSGCGINISIAEGALLKTSRAIWGRNLLGKALMLVRRHLRKPDRPAHPTDEELAAAERIEEDIDDGRDFFCEDCDEIGDIE